MRAILSLAMLVLAGCATQTPAAQGALAATSGILPAWTEGHGGTAQVPISGGTLPYTCALDAAATLPPGFSLSACAIVGTAGLLPSGTSKTLSAPFLVNVTDASGARVVATLQIAIVRGAPTLTANDANCTVGVPCRVGLATATGLDKPYSITAFPIPAGFFVDNEGTLTGTPATPGVFPMEVCASDLVGSRVCDDAQLTVAAANNNNEGEDPEAGDGTGGAGGNDTTPEPPGPPVEETDETPLDVLLYYPTCNTRPEGGWEIRASGSAAGPRGASLVVLIYPVGAAPALSSEGILMEADWDNLPAPTVPYEPLNGEAAAPIPQKERGDPNSTLWQMTHALVPASEVDREYRVVARTLTAGNSSDPAEGKVRCYAPLAARAVSILSATCTLVSTGTIPAGAGEAQTTWTWQMTISGNVSGRLDDGFVLNADGPYHAVTSKSGGELTIGWTKSPTRTVDRFDAHWTVSRATGDPALANWTISPLVINDQEYNSLVPDHKTTWHLFAGGFQVSALKDVTCPK